MNDKLNIDTLNSVNTFVSLGCLSPEMVQFITDRVPALQGILSPSCDILFWKDRIPHTARHKNDFASDYEYDHCFENIPQIIHSPDYISYSKKDNSLSFIRQFSDKTSVAIRISHDGKLSYRTMYPIMSATLSHYLERGTAWKYI